MSRLNNLYLFLNDEKGRTLPRAKLFFYENNSFDFKNTYADKALTSVNPNPVIADGAGRFPNIFLEADTYRVVLQDEDGVEISTKDDVDNLLSDGDDVSNTTVTTSTGSQTVAGALDDRVVRVGSVAELQQLDHTELSTNQGIKVTATSRSGDFTWFNGDFSTQVAADPLGIQYIPVNSNPSGSLGCAIRVITGPVLAQWAGFTANADVTSAVSAISSQFDQGSLVYAPSATVLMDSAYTEKLQFIGLSKKSVFQAAVGASHIIDFGRHVNDWDYHEQKNLTFNGNGKASDGVRFNDDNVSAPEFGGRWVFDTCRWTACDKGVYHATGNIGNRYINSNFSGNNYGCYLQDAPGATMQAGATLWEGCEFSSNALAAIYINDAQDGMGQYSIRDCVIEGNPGFGIFADFNSITPFTGLNLDHVWFEENALNSAVTIDGIAYTTRDMRIKNAKPIMATGCYIKDIELVNSTLIGNECRMDDATGTYNIVLDNDSQIIMNDLYANGRGNGKAFVRSIARQQKLAAINTFLSWRGPLKATKLPTTAVVVYANYYDGSGPWTFTGTSSVNATSVSDGVIHNTCAELVIPTGNTLLSGDTGTPTAGKWAVYSIHAKLVSGSTPSTADLGGGGTTFGEVYFHKNAWTCSYGVAKVGPSPTLSRLRFINNTGAPITVRLADMFVYEFDTEPEAVEFANSKAIPKL